MKIVLNKCYGGFSLSPEAVLKIYKRKGLTVYPYVSKSTQDFMKTEWIRYQGQKLESILATICYFEKDPGSDSFVASYTEVDDKYNMIDIDFDEDNMRSDNDLIAVVVELGDKANGTFAKLRVVEIPDGAEFNISDYDGIETAHYGFKTGSV